MFNPMQRVSVGPRSKLRHVEYRERYANRIARRRRRCGYNLFSSSYLYNIFTLFSSLRFHSENLHLYRLYNVMLYVYVFI